MRCEVRLKGFFLSLLSIPLLALAAGDETDPYTDYRGELDYNEALEVPWVELETQVKSLPDDSQLTRVELDTLPPGLSLYVDLENMTLDERDHVIRAWFVVRSKRGAYNGTFEGFRCANHRYKVYAYANPKRSRPLRLVDLPRWREIRLHDYRDELAKSYLCDETIPREAAQIKAVLGRDSTSYDAPY